MNNTYLVKNGVRLGHQQQRFIVWETVNPNAHNVRYGRDCHAAPVPVGTIIARNLQEAWTRADEQFGYHPEWQSYNWLLSHVTLA